MTIEEALPPEAVFVEKMGPNEVWQTERWMYLVVPKTHRVLNVVRREGPE